ncbi:hypothetical protein QWY14_13740 [Planococcus sp. N028]|uniref:DUF4279 domain-containing protein n=1 Tax=Planococcus shixiaomingii TaxID=3058393 RepID=A0ABT8N4Q6_9BACL|nr:MULTISPECIES: hypothetical protein [unclassified Planococcus (in: firmicutes)]MDN7242871.1 hypothetical protein [Planococcus sp. N028]WKA55503.1 hypothetical protein QWY21_03725 [Planococcus sp. N022]
MSIATYIGLNFPVKLPEDYIEDKIEIEYVFSEEEHRQAVKEKHFTVPHIYEISVTEHAIWEMNEYQKIRSPHSYEKAQKTFLSVCLLLKELLPAGDFCEIYICWLGDEKEEHEKELTINLNDLQIEALDIHENCFIRIEN